MSKRMRRLAKLTLVLLGVLAAGTLEAGEKALKVGPEGVKMEGALKEDDPRTTIEINQVVKLDLISRKIPVRLEKGLRYTFTMRSETIDCVLGLQDAKGKQVASNDDFGEKFDSRVVFIPAESGDFALFACSLGNRAGPYTLAIETGKVNLVDLKKIYDPAKGPETLDGTLTMDALKQVVQVKLQAGKTYRFDLRSKAFDCFLVLEDSDGKKLEEDDDGGEGFNSRITFRAPADGTYRLVASSLGMNRPGAYELSIREEK